MTRLERANRAYLKLWNKTSKLYGAEGRPAPQAALGGGLPPNVPPDAIAAAYWETDNSPAKTYLSERLFRDLASRGRKKRERRWDAQESLVHEWAHVYQAPEFRLNDELGREQAANLFAQKVMHKMGRARPAKKNLLYDDFQRKYGRGYLTRGQFGSNYGADPNALTYTGS